MTLYTEQSKNVRKTWFLMAIFLAVVVGLGWFLSYFYNSPDILVFAVIFSVVMNVGSYWYSDKIVLAMTGAKPVTREENPLLWNVVENLSITAGLPMPRVYVIDDPVPNAFATGRDKEHSAVAVTSGLMKMLDRSELEGVMAHELSHIGNKDILISTVVVVLVGFITLIADYFLRFGGFRHGGGDRNRGGGQLQAILMVVGIIFVILSPIIATLIQLAISRKREFLADASGALLTRYPDGLASALKKISQYGGRMKSASNATAHLFIANPFGSKKEGTSRKWFAGLFQTHPPVEERVRALMGERI